MSYGKRVFGYTTHGHRIEGVPSVDDQRPEKVARCGGPGLCDKCSTEAEAAWNALGGRNFRPAGYELHPEDAAVLTIHEAYIPKHMKEGPKHMDLESDTTIRVDFNLKISEVSNLLLHLNQLGYEFEASTKRR